LRTGAIPMHQLDLFQDAPRYYITAVERLGRLDWEGVEQALDAHARVFPRGPDPEPVRRAARWLRAAVPPPEVPRQGPDALQVCRTLLEGGSPDPFLRERPDLCRRVARTVGSLFLRSARAAGIPLTEPLAQGLPWGVFGLWAGRVDDAREALEAVVRSDPEASLAWLALGDALTLQGNAPAARAAYREGFGLLPREDGWPLADPAVVRAREEIRAEALWGGSWWAVGAYEEGVFPRYARLEPAETQIRAERFLRLCREGRHPEAFFQGIAVSEQGEAAGMDLCATVRRGMRGLNPEAFVLHMERIRRRDAP